MNNICPLLLLCCYFVLFLFFVSQDAKTDFLEQFKKNKGSLKWVYDFNQTIKVEKKTTAVEVEASMRMRVIDFNLLDVFCRARGTPHE